MNVFLRLATVAASALFAGNAAADTVKVGLIANFTGGMAVYGSQFQQAIQAYQALNGTTVKGPDGKEHTVEFIFATRCSSSPASTCRPTPWRSARSPIRPRCPSLS